MTITNSAPTIQTVKKLPSGALRVYGLAASWAGIDRQGENFAAGAFAAGIDRALNRGAGLPLLHQHKYEHTLGRVEGLWETDEGLMMDAVVNYHEPASNLRNAYTGILNGSIRGLSVGGAFTRDTTKSYPLIVGVDLVEVSTTAVPVHDGTWLKVVDIGADPYADALAGAQLALLRAELAVAGVRT